MGDPGAPHTDRIACPWLIRKFIDPEAEIVYVPRDEVLAVRRARGRHQLRRAGRAVHPPRRHVLVRGARRGVQAWRGPGAGARGAGRPRRRRVRGRRRDAAVARARGHRRGFMHLGVDDQRQLELELPVYDALYAWAQQQVRGDA